MFYNFLFRLIITVSVFIALKINNVTSLPLLVIILFLFDVLDCGLSPIPIDSKTYQYQKKDKVMDILMYAFFVTLFHDLFDAMTLKLLVGFIVIRAIGVFKFYSTGNTKYLKYFPDFINSTMIAYTIYVQFSLSRSTYYIMIIIGMIIKIFFEFKFHDRVYIRS